MKILNFVKKYLLLLVITSLCNTHVSEAKKGHGGGHHGRHRRGYGGFGRRRYGGLGLGIGFGRGYGSGYWGYPYGYGGYRRPYYYNSPRYRYSKDYDDKVWNVVNNTPGTIKVYVGDRTYKVRKGQTADIRQTSNRKFRIKSVYTGESKIITTSSPYIELEVEDGKLEIETSS